MEAASFTAWQMLRAKGLKKNWTQYRRAMGLTPKSERKVEKADRDKAVATALSIDAAINRSRK